MKRQRNEISDSKWEVGGTTSETTQSEGRSRQVLQPPDVGRDMSSENLSFAKRCGSVGATQMSEGRGRSRSKGLEAGDCSDLAAETSR